MAESLGEAVLDLRTDDTGYRRGIGKAGNLAKKLESQFNSAGKALQNIGTRLTLFVTTPLIGAAAAAATLAIGAEETANKFQVVFRGSVREADDALKNLTKSIPLTQNEMRELSAGVQDLIVPMGLARDEAAKLSIQAVRVAGDLASFSNALPEEALNAVKSALSGSSEPLRRFGVDTRETRLQTLALNSGLIKQGQEFTATARAQAVFLALTKDSSDAIGDAAKTVGSASNQLKFLQTDIRLIGEQLGTVFIPLIKQIVPDIRDWLQGIIDLSARQKVLIVVVGGLITVIGPLLIGLGLLIQLTGVALAGFVALGGGLIAPAVGFFNLTVSIGGAIASLFTFNALTVISSGVTILASGISVLAAGFLRLARSIVLSTILLRFIVSGSLLSIIGTGVAALGVGFVALAKRIALGTLAFLRFIVMTLGIPAVFVTVLASIIVFKETIVTTFSGMITAIKNAFVAGFRNKVVVPFQKAINALVEFLPDSVSEFLGLKPIGVDDFIEGTFVEDIKTTIANATTQAGIDLAGFKTGAGRAIDGIKAVFSKITGIIKKALPGGDLLDGITAQVEASLAKLIEGTQAADNKIKSLGEDTKTVSDVIDESFKNIGDSIGNSIGDAVTNGKNLLRSLGDIARSILSSIISGIAKIAFQKAAVKFGLGAVLGMAHGGQIQVGGNSGTDNNVLALNGSPIARVSRGETIGVTPTGGGGGGINQTINIPLAFPPQLEAFVRNVAGPAGRDAAVQVLQAQGGRG